MNVSQRSSHTHCQAPKANTLTKAWQRVCLPIPEIKEENQTRLPKYFVRRAGKNLSLPDKKEGQSASKKHWEGGY